MLLHSGSGNLVGDEGFRNALFMIDIGQNDLADSFAKNLSYTEVVKMIPSFVTEIRNAIQVISLITNCSLFLASPPKRRKYIRYKNISRLICKKAWEG